MLLLFLNSCNEKEYRKIESIFGVFPEDSITLQYLILPDTLKITPFKKKTFDSVKTAKKADDIKKRILSKPTIISRTNPLNGFAEDARFMALKRKQLFDSYKKYEKKPKKDTAQ